MPLRIRFRIYNPPTSSFFSSMSDNFGWYIDDITFSNVEVLVEGITSEGTSPQWTFSSPDSAVFLLRAQIINNTNTLRYPIGPYQVQLDVLRHPSCRCRNTAIRTCSGQHW